MAESVFRADEAQDWKRAPLDAGKPYSVWGAPKMPWWCVCDKNGLNVMTRGTGQVFTDEVTANKLCEAWNG